MAANMKATTSSGLALLQLLSGPRTQLEINAGVRAQHASLKLKKGTNWIRVAISQTLLPRKLVELQGRPGSQRLVSLTAAARTAFRAFLIFCLHSPGVAGTSRGAAAARRSEQHAGRALFSRARDRRHREFHSLSASQHAELRPWPRQELERCGAGPPRPEARGSYQVLDDCSRTAPQAFGCPRACGEHALWAPASLAIHRHGPSAST